jgi:hypothetical protein
MASSTPRLKPSKAIKYRTYPFQSAICLSACLPVSHSFPPCHAGIGRAIVSGRLRLSVPLECSDSLLMVCQLDGAQLQVARRCMSCFG